MRGSKDREKRIGPDPSNDKGNQSIWERLGRWKVLFPPSAVWSQGSVRGQEYDPSPRASEVLIHGLHSLPMFLSIGHDWFPIAVIWSESTLTYRSEEDFISK